MNRQHEKPPEFDRFAESYPELIRDPIRDRFASGGRFFFERKIEIIQAYFRKTGTQTQQLDWLDVGCGQGNLLRLAGANFKSAAGCDPSGEMLKSCGDLNVRCQTSVAALPYDDASFDFLTAV